jgi:serine/threonine-protein phosphatase 6 regulatory ankyrin repeat subunit B
MKTLQARTAVAAVGALAFALMAAANEPATSSAPPSSPSPPAGSDRQPGLWNRATGWAASLNPFHHKSGASAPADPASPSNPQAAQMALEGNSTVVKPRPRDSAAADAAKKALRTKQFATALQGLQAAAQKGDVQSEYLLGLVYANGLGTPISEENARHWLTAAAEKSHAEAAYALAGLLAMGSTTDREQAQKWLARAAREGHAVATKLVASHSLPLAPARSTSGALARELLVWAIRHDEASVEAFAKVAGIETVDEFGRSALAYAVTSGSESAVTQLLSAGAQAGHADHFGVTPMMLAAEGESGAILQALLGARDHVDLNARDNGGNTALFYAARAGRTANVERLLSAGAAFDPSNSNGWTAVDVASKAGHADIVQMLRKAGATGSLKASLVRESSGVDPTRPGAMYSGWPALVIAASRDDARLVEKLLADGARPDEPTSQGGTALTVASQYHAASVIAPLLKAGANPARADADGNTALGYAAAHGDLAVVDAMLQKAVSPDTHGRTEEPPIVRATRAGNADIVKHLIDAGANVNAAAANGITALMVAAGAPDPQIVQLLMAANPNLALKDRTGRNALWFAAGAGNDEIADELLAAGSPIDGSGTQQSPLFAAVQSGRPRMLERLLRKGLPPDARNAADDTPLIAAAARGDADIVRILLDGGAAIDAQNAAGNTALIAAAREGHIDVFRLLLKAGANTSLHNQDRINALDTAKRRNLPQIVALLEQE